MSTATTSTVEVVPAEESGVVSHPKARLLWVSVAHGVVDFFSYIIIPLVTVLEASSHFSPEQGALLLGFGSIASGAIQPVVALVSDRFDTRWLGTAGAVIAAIALGAIGYVQSFWLLMVLQVVGSAGVGAFHPVAAAAVGHFCGKQRARGVAIFYSAGMFGSVGAGLIMPWYAEHLGLKAIAWLIGPGLLFSVILAWTMHGVPHRHASAVADHAALPAAERKRRWVDIGLLYTSNVVRFIVNMMLVQLLIRWSELRVLSTNEASTLTEEMRHGASQINGPLQAAMAIGMGIAGILVGLVVKPRMERPLLIVIPVLGAIGIAAFPWAAGWGGVPAAFVFSIIGGVGYAGVVPITISLAQRLLPHRTSLASGLMMGGAWSVGAVGPPLAQWLDERWGLAWGFGVTGALLLIAAGLGARVRTEVGGRH